MAATFDAATTGGENGSVATTTISHTCTGSNGALFVGVTTDFNIFDVSITGITYNGDAMTLQHTGDRGFVHRTAYYSLLAPDAGTHDVVITWSASQAAGRAIGIVSYAGVDSLRTQQNANGGSSAPTITYTNGQSGDLIIDFAGTRPDVSSTVGAGQTQRVNHTANSLTVLMSEQAGDTSVVMDWSASATDWRSTAIGLVASAVAGSTSGRLVNNRALKRLVGPRMAG